MAYFLNNSPALPCTNLSFGQTSIMEFISRLNVVPLAVISLLAWTHESPAGDATAGRPAILVLGDSLSAGYGVDPDQAYPALLQKKIDAAGLNFTIVNAGLSGDTTAGGLRRLNWLLQRKIDVLILELGANDGLRGVPAGATRSNLQATIDQARQAYPRIKILIAGMQMPPNLGQDYIQAFNRIFPDLAEKNHTALIPFLLEGVAGNPAVNLPDGIHPTAEGHKIVCENVWRILKPMLENPAGKPS
jgi:acyl-CoA thioesterase-1